MNHNYAGTQQIGPQSARGTIGGVNANDVRELREVEREVQRLVRAAGDVQMLQNELGARLERYMVQQPAELSTKDAPDSVVCCAAGNEIRDITRSVESSAAGLRYLLQTLAI